MILPAIGFGTSPYRAGGEPLDVSQPVRLALQAGYRLFDLAEAYGNESAIGRLLRSRGTPPRSELYLIGKAWRTNAHPTRLRRACEASLQRLGIESFDLYLLHAPGALRHVAPLSDAEEIGWGELMGRATPRDENGELIPDEVPLLETWEAMQGLVSAGLTARIGVSNFSLHEIDTLGANPPAANQVPCWPFDSTRLHAHRRREITLIGYSPLKREVLDAPLVRTVAAAHRKTPAQLILRWLVDRGVHPLTSSTNPAHIRENIAAAELELSPGEHDAVDSLVASGPGL